VRMNITQFVTRDGVSQGPGSADQDTSDDFERGGWLVPYLDARSDPDRAAPPRARDDGTGAARRLHECWRSLNQREAERRGIP